MKNNDIHELFKFLNQTVFGDSLVTRCENQQNLLKIPSYPPSNIIKYDENKYKIEMALAGFKKDEIDIELSSRDKLLTIVGKKDKETDESNSIEDNMYLVRNLAKRNFKFELLTPDYSEISEAKLEDGILSINLVINIPDEVKPKKINIS